MSDAPYSTTPVEKILAMCEPHDDCLIWTGKSGGRPSSPAIREGGARKMCRRIVAQSKHQQPITSGMRFITSCRNPLCLAPKHIVMATHRKIAKLAYKEGSVDELARRARICATKRSRSEKLNPEKVAAIRSSTNVAQTARDLGISKSLAYLVRRGKVWSSTQIKGNSVFNQNI